MPRTMPLLALVLILVLAVADARLAGQDAKAVLDTAAKALGAASLTSIQYSGAGSNYALGQAPNATAPWPRFEVKSYTAVVDYATPAMRQEMVRTQGENPPRGGGGQPLIGEQRQIQIVSGNTAWNMAGANAQAAPTAVTERQLQIWLTPHGFVKGATAATATLRSQTVGGRRLQIVTFTTPSKAKINGYINDQGLVEKTETWIDNPVLGDMLAETTFTDYKDYGGVKFPSRIVQRQGGHPVLDIHVSSVQPNASADLAAPAGVQGASAPAVRVERTQVADGVWYLTGGSHHSVVVEFKDHVVVIEAPQNEERSIAVINGVKSALPNKPIRNLVNTHQHFDHSGGLRTYAAEGVTIITHTTYKPYYEKVWSAPRTLNPDRLAQSNRKAAIVGVGDRHVLSDGTRTIELHVIKGNPHNDALLMAWLPKERILIEADAFNPPAPNAPPPPTPNPFSVNLYENVTRLKLDVAQIVPIHGRVVTMEDLRKAIGKAAGTQQ